jgi:hypothetical protein
MITPSFVIRSRPQNVKPGTLNSELDLPWEINLYAQYHITNHADLFAKLNNVTDHRYALSGITGDAIPQETFNGMVGVKLSF